MLTYTLSGRAAHVVACCFALYLALTVWLARFFFNWGDANTFMAVALLPYVLICREGRFSARYFFPAIIAVGLAILLPVKSLLYLSLIFSGLFLLESCRGKTHAEVLWLLIVASPLFKQMSRLVEFPVRLWLTARVAGMVSLNGAHATASGNLITTGKYEFAVDDACAGLNMLVTSLLVCIFLIAFYRRKTGSVLKGRQLLVILISTLLLNLVCNFFRIWFIVQFRIMPGTAMHDVAGLLCLLVYVIVPLMAGVRYVFLHYGRQAVSGEPATNALMAYPYVQLIFLVVNVYCALHLHNIDDMYGMSASNISIKGYQKQTLSNGVLRFNDDRSMVYIKPTAFYAPEHDPMICWVGSGYEFRAIKERVIVGTKIYTGTLQKDSAIIYTAWWFDNGRIKTNNQLTWRWQAATGANDFCLINVNAASPAYLETALRKIIGQKIIPVK